MAEEVELCTCAHVKTDHTEGGDGTFGECNIVNCDCTSFDKL